MLNVDLASRCGIVLLSGVIYWGGVYLLGRLVKRCIGRVPNLRPRASRERILWLGWILVAAVWLGFPLYLLTSPASSLTPPTAWLVPWLFWLGLCLTLLGYAATLWCYRAMGTHWRIFIDPKERTPLITSGPYRWIRHPIYAFQILMLLGAVLLLPHVLTISALSLQLTLSVAKLRDEETYLLTLHGAAYRTYKTTTGALIPWL